MSYVYCTCGFPYTAFSIGYCDFSQVPLPDYLPSQSDIAQLQLTAIILPSSQIDIR